MALLVLLALQAQTLLFRALQVRMVLLVLLALLVPLLLFRALQVRMVLLVLLGLQVLRVQQVQVVQMAPQAQ